MTLLKISAAKQSLNKTYLCRARTGGARISAGKALMGKKVKLKLSGPQIDDPELKENLNLGGAVLSLEEALSNTYQVKHHTNKCFINLPLVMIGKKVKLELVEVEEEE